VSDDLMDFLCGADDAPVRPFYVPKVPELFRHAETLTVEHARFGSLIFDRIQECDNGFLYWMRHAIPNKVFDAPEQLMVGRLTDGLYRQNHSDRAMYGSGNYEQSNIRQWANSAEPAGRWYRPATIYDKPPHYRDEPGFLHGFPQEFLDRLRPALVPTRTNDMFETDVECGVLRECADFMFLPSFTEFTGKPNRGIPEGKQWEPFVGLSDRELFERLKKTDINGSAAWYWQRSCIPGSPEYAGNVSVGGNPWSIDYAGYPLSGFAPACIIE